MGIVIKWYERYHWFRHQVKFANREARLTSFFGWNSATKNMDRKDYIRYVLTLMKFIKVESPYKAYDPVKIPRSLKRFQKESK
jgi:hypothetical protein